MITDEQHIWLEQALDKNLTVLEVKKKLQDNGNNYETVKEMVFVYSDMVDRYQVPETKTTKEEEKEFEEDVHKFLKDEKLSFMKKRKVKSFLKNVRAYNLILQGTIQKFKEEIKKMNELFDKDDAKLNDELLILKLEIINTLWDAKELFDIYHPYSDKLIETKSELKDVDLDDLILVLEDCVKQSDLVVNGKIIKEGEDESK